MKSINSKLGKFIVQKNQRNTELKYSVESVCGVNNLKELMPTRADLNGRDISKFLIVEPGDFVYNHRTSRHGGKFCIAYNNGEKPIICTEDYTVFAIRNESKKDLLAQWLFLYFSRPECDRYVMYSSWGSSTEFFGWDEICDIDIELPPLSVQQKYVDIYNAMIANQQSYERGLDDLKLVCFSSIEKLRKTEKLHRIGNYIAPYSEKNFDGKITLEQGINIDKKFITPQRSNSNLQGRKIVRQGMFAYCTQLNNANVAIAYREGPDCVVSSVYDIFEIKDKDNLLPGYLMLWLIRPEFGRFVYWASEGSAYEFLNYNNLANYKIPIPEMSIQKAIADIFAVYNERKKINDQLKSQIKDICPILIKGSLEECAK